MNNEYNYEIQRCCKKYWINPQKDIRPTADRKIAVVVYITVLHKI